MFYITTGKHFVDTELELLSDFLLLLDSKLEQIEMEIQQSSCPDSQGYFDKAEYYVGLGFSTIQQYMSSTYPQVNISKKKALNIGKRFNSGSYVVAIINATANYWKHENEWDLTNIVMKDISRLEGIAYKTVKLIQEVTPWADYTCTNVVAGLTNVGNMKLSPLIPILTEWRGEISKNS